MSKLNIDQPGFLSEKLASAELPVDPSVWQQVSQQLPSAPTATGAESAAGSQAAAGASIASKVGLWVAGIAAAGAITYGVFVATSPEPSTLPASEEVQEIPVVTEATSGEVAAETNEASDSVQPESQDMSANDLPASADQAKSKNRGSGNTVSSLDSEPQTPESATQAMQSAQPKVTSPNALNQTDDQSQTTESDEIAAPDIDMDADFTVVFSAFDEFQAEFSPIWGGAATYRWDFGDGATSQEAAPRHWYETEGDYLVTLSVEDETGHSEQYTASVKVIETPVLELPNIFTPNNDGQNDVLTIGSGSKNVSVLRMIVFNMQGQLVFEQLGEGDGWDGSLSSGDLAPDGNYRLIVTAQGTDGKQYNESAIVRLQR